MIFISYRYYCQSKISKAGRLVGLAGCYAAIVLADNATFLLAVNRIAAFTWHSAITPVVIISSCGSVGRASAPYCWGHGFESHLGQEISTCLCPLRQSRSVRNYPTSAEGATPKPLSLKNKSLSAPVIKKYLEIIIYISLILFIRHRHVIVLHLMEISCVLQQHPKRTLS